MKLQTTKSLPGRHFFGVFSTSKKPDKFMYNKISRILTNLMDRKESLGLIEDAIVTRGEFPKDFRPRSAVLDYYPKDCFYGRETEEKSMLERLLSTGDHVKVINIVGWEGEGKTAFAEVIYLNHKVRESFELTAWLTGPSYKAKASVKFMAKEILEVITQRLITSYDFDLLGKILKEKFAWKKFLLVLDDCRIADNLDNWKMLIASLEATARGGAVILTSSPSDDPLPMPPADYTLPLGLLSTDHCWSIFLAHAFRQKDLNDDLVAHGRKIVNRLGNLPLAAKMIGSLLQDKLNLHALLMILGNLLLVAGDVNPHLHIPSSLVLCYLDLPAQLMRCFAYLSTFPKGYKFKQKEVVLMWMAQGFLRHSNSDGKSMEDIGDDYFGYLIMRSFLQPLDAGASFIMHNLVHDLATYAYRKVGRHRKADQLVHDLATYEPEIPRRHHKEFTDEYFNTFGSRTILAATLPFGEEVLKQIAPKNEFLRVLSLSHLDIPWLSDSIGSLSHLRYLDLSHTPLRTLPDSITYLRNLQTLLLTHCRSLTSFPRRMCDLINLRYLDVRNSGVQEMPLKMHKLTSLRTLTDFIVSKNGPRFRELAGLSNLKTLTISKLQNVVCAMDASDVRLKEKNSLDDLMLQWGNGHDGNGNEMEVLENLEPHRDIKRLTIEYYRGTRFPNWLGDASYWALQLLRLRHCENCTSLPTLGLLPFLKDLSIEGFTKVSSVGHEVYGVMTASHKPFQSLKSLQFGEMLEWKEWNILEGIEFPSLIELYIIQCPKLVGDLPKQLLSLEKLKITGCCDLLASLPKVSNACQVFVGDSNEIWMRNYVKIRSQTSLRRVTIPEEVQELTPQSYSGFSSAKHAIAPSSTEIEEIGHEARMETESTRNRLPPDPVSLDTTRIPELKELSSGLLSPQVEADIPNTKQQTDPQSSLAKADTLIATHAAVLPLTVTPDRTAHVKVENLSREDLDDQ